MHNQIALNGDRLPTHIPFEPSVGMCLTINGDVHELTFVSWCMEGYYECESKVVRHGRTTSATDTEADAGGRGQGDKPGDNVSTVRGSSVGQQNDKSSRPRRAKKRVSKS